MSTTKVLMLGTGTPNPVPERSGPCTAVIVGDRSYIVDAGTGVVRQAERARKKYDISALDAPNLKRVFITHLHSDHTIGLPDLIYTPWVLERKEALHIYGPVGVKHMADCLLSAYKDDIHARKYGLEYANEEGIKIVAKEIEEGTVYEDACVKIDTVRVTHPPFDAFAYRFTTPDKVIVISGDTAPDENLVRFAKGCDILVHEVISAAGVKKRDPKWFAYHTTVHTDSKQLACIAQKAAPKTLVLYHQLFMVAPDDAGRMVSEEERENEMIADIAEKYSGRIISAKDLDMLE